MTGAVLLVPCCEKGKGGGHLSRCIKLVNELRGVNREAYLFIPENINIDNFLRTSQFNRSFILSEKGILKRNWELIILDRYQTPRDELANWKKIAPVIGIDEGGLFRDYFDFLLDILIPENFEKPSANITSCALLDLPKKRKNAQDAGNTDKLRILISFGQEDAANLGLSTIKKIAKTNLKDAEITLLKGRLNKSEYQIPDYIKIMDSIPNLAERLYEYDLVITHYGLTAYEALYAGAKVLLDHPTPYHKKIAKAAGFWDIKKLNLFVKPNVNRQPPDRFGRQAARNGKGIQIKKSCESLLKIKEQTLAELINSFSAQVNRSCPVCGADTPLRSTARFYDRTYRRCQKCGAIYMDRTCPPPIEYEREYFFEAYKKQYGKTYLEDFPSLIAMAKRRLEIISTLSCRDAKNKKNGSSPLILDIGCAYGPFLAAAKEEGFLPFGVDPAKDAVCYVQQTLGIPAVHGFFPNCQLPDSQLYDVITLWYVIEHFTDCLTVLAEIKKLLKIGGILAFSTPSFSGVSGRKSLRNFLEKSPADHFTIWSPKMCKKALAIAGFKVKKIVISGCHPERFPLLGKFAKNKKSPLYWLLFAVSRILGLGDTFEVYAKLL